MTERDEAWREQLAEAALAAQLRAYAPYSNFRVGAAIVHSSGLIFTGANVENASFGLTLCAERVAVTAAVTAAEVHAMSEHTEDRDIVRNWRAIAIASPGGVSPCGACRQVLMEFAPGMEVLLVDSSTKTIKQVSPLANLLPSAFELEPPPQKG